MINKLLATQPRGSANARLWHSMETSSQNALVTGGLSTQTPPTSSASLPGDSQVLKAGPKDLRLPRGKHKGKPLSGVPADYISWLQNRSDAYNASKTMQDAVQWHLSSQASQSSQQLSQSQSFTGQSFQASRENQEIVPPASSLLIKQPADGHTC